MPAGPAPFDPPLPVVAPPLPFREDVVAERIRDVLASGLLKWGNRWTMHLQARLAEVLKVSGDRRVVVTNSGTAALRLACRALTGSASDRPRTAVLPAYTFAATGEFLAQLGFRTVYCDVDPQTWTLSPLALAEIVTHRQVDLVVSVDALGNPADFADLLNVCRPAGIPLLSDSAPSIASLYRGAPVGTQADGHAFSFSFAKVVSAAGAGGLAVLPADALLEDDANWLRSSLMGEVNAIVALDQVEHLDVLVARRRAVAEIYDELLGSCERVEIQHVRPGNRHGLVHWVALVDDRDRLSDALQAQGVQTRPYYFPALHSALPLSRRPRLPVTEALARTALALPLSCRMTTEDARRVAQAVLSCLNHRRAD